MRTRHRPGAVVALALIALGSGCRRAPETRFLNFDPESSTGALVGGFSGWEKTGDGDTFVWCQSRVARVAVASGAGGDALVRVRLWPFRYPGAPPQTMTLFVNETRVESTEVPDVARVYSFATPRAAWRPGLNELRFEFGYAEAPKDRVPGGGDARTLAAAFDWVEIVPLPSKP